MKDELAEIVEFREPLPADVPFFLDTWYRCWRESPYAGCVRNDEAHSTTVSTITGLLARGARFSVACSRHDRNAILGYVCSEHVKDGLAVHFLYVKDPFRRMGLGTALLEKVNGQAQDEGRGGRRFYTHRTRGSGYFHGWDWQPAIARRK